MKPFTTTPLLAAIAIVASTQPPHASSEVTATDVISVAEMVLPPSGPMLYGGLTAHEVACLMGPDDLPCWRELGERDL